MSDENEDAYKNDIHALVDLFTDWIGDFENQRYFYSAQEAYLNWLEEEGFQDLGDNYGEAVAVILVFLSRCIANPINRRFLCHPSDEVDEWALLQVSAPLPNDRLTYWEFLTEKNFHARYRAWRERQLAR